MPPWAAEIADLGRDLDPGVKRDDPYSILIVPPKLGWYKIVLNYPHPFCAYLSAQSGLPLRMWRLVGGRP